MVKCNKVKALAMCGVMVLMLAACDKAPVKPDAPAPVRILAKGLHSGVKRQEYYDLHKASDFAVWWHRAYATRSYKPTLPDVDFSKDMVIAVFMGEKTHGGYSIAVTNVQVAADNYDVEITVTVPGPGCRTTQALTQPFEFVAVPDSDGKFVNWKVRQYLLTCQH